MSKRRQAAGIRQDRTFKGRQFTAEVILWAVRWYLMFPIRYRDLELILVDRGVDVDHTTIFRWIQAYAAELEKRIRPHLLRQVKYLNNILEQDHRKMKRLIDPRLGFGSFWTARRTLAGYEAMAMIRKGLVRNIGGSDIRAQAKFIAGLFQFAA